MNYTIEQIAAVVPRCWGPDTSVFRDTWKPSNPSSGQCAVTALVVEELTGSPVVHGRVVFRDGHYASHYWNEGGDLTAEQFTKPGLYKHFVYYVLPIPDQKTAHEYLLAYASDEARYHVLKRRVLDALNRV